MVEVATRTSKSGVLTDVEKNASNVFDVRSWKGLTEILKAARASKMSADDYSAFRDAVLQYAQGGGSDASLRKQIETTAATFAITPSAPTQEKSTPVKASDESKNTPQVAFTAHTRPAPRFNNGKDETKFTEERVKNVAQSTHIETKPPVEAGVVPKNLPVASSSHGSSVPKFNTQEETVKADSTNKHEETVRQVESVTAPRQVSTGIKTVEEYKARIADIKRTVNAQVGNPITLMDGENAIGREYMTALLAAMKAVSGTAPGTLQTSMDQLEKVFARITTLPQKAEVVSEKKYTKPEVSTPISAANVASVNNASFAVGQTTAQKEARTQPSDITESKKEREVEKQNEPVRQHQSSAPLGITSRENTLARMQPQTSKEDVVAHTSKPNVEQKQVNVASNPSSNTSVLRSQPKPVASSHAIPSLAETLQNAGVAPAAKKPEQTVASASMTSRPQSSAPKTNTPVAEKKPLRVERIGETSAAVGAMGKHSAKGVGRSGFDATVEGDSDHPVPQGVTDDLHTPEVEAGLTQLLHEWSIFQGGGLFGTGPSGIEHPLYKKLAPLPMSIVGAGTWEGASKEAILSIRDYINGWLHEQGVSYIQTESFENYLRRVVKRILKRTGV